MIVVPHENDERFSKPPFDLNVCLKKDGGKAWWRGKEVVVIGGSLDNDLRVAVHMNKLLSILPIIDLLNYEYGAEQSKNIHREDVRLYQHNRLK